MTLWSNYVQYYCRHPSCQEECINHIDQSRTIYKECRDCHLVDAGADLDPITNHLPDQPTESERKADPTCPDARPVGEHPGMERERQSRSTADRPAGSAPLRGDPGARAPPPNPEGEENLQTRTPDDEPLVLDRD